MKYIGSNKNMTSMTLLNILILSIQKRELISQNKSDNIRKLVLINNFIREVTDNIIKEEASWINDCLELTHLKL